MDCNNARKQIVPYIKSQLSMEDTRQFIRHVNECSECKDELEIYYILEHGLSGEEAEISFDFTKSLNEQLETDEKNIDSEQALLAYYQLVYDVASVVLFVTVGIFVFAYLI